MIDTATNGASAQAGANLMIAVNVIAGIVRFDPVDLVVTHVQAQRAAAAAVYGAGSPDNLIFRRLYGVLNRGGGASQTKR
jgi:hypothetical protein